MVGLVIIEIGSTMYLVEFIDNMSNGSWRVYRKKAHAKSAIKLTLKPKGDYQAAILYEFEKFDLRLIEQHGRMNVHVEGQEPLF